MATVVLALAGWVGCMEEPVDGVSDGDGADGGGSEDERGPSEGGPTWAAVARVTINEIESSGGVPADWVELVNTGGKAADLGGWRLRDGGTSAAYVFPAGTRLGVGGYLVVHRSSFGFDLDASDAARLYSKAGALVDSYAWTAHAAVTYGRCPAGSGDFRPTSVATPGGANTCGAVPPPLEAWPGQDAVLAVDEAGRFPGNLSDLVHAAASDPAEDELWAVQNDPSLLHRLRWNGAAWAPPAGSGWESGKTLRYPGGTGRPDAEGLTHAESAAVAYVAAERDNAASTVSRLSVLRYDAAAPGAELIASHEWNLTADLPAVGANAGLEAITWLPDAFLVQRGFFDEAAGQLYDPLAYPDHGAGLFFVGVEATGAIHAYALDHATGGFTRVATLASGHAGVMSLAFDRDAGQLWAACDAACGGTTAVLDVDVAAGSPTLGRFVVSRRFARPTSMANLDNEGIAFAPEARCAGGWKPFYWTEDGSTDGHALRADTIPCGRLAP